MLNWILLTIVLNIIAYLIEFILDFMQSRKLRTATIPMKLLDYIEDEEFNKMKSYSLLRLAFSRLESTYGVISEVGILLCGVLIWVRKFSVQIDLFLYETIFPGSEPPDAQDECFIIAQGVTFIFIVSLSSAVMKTPFEMYRIFVIDTGFNFGARVANYILDQLKMFFIAFVVGIPLLALILKLIMIGSPVDWVYVWLGSAALIVGLFELYPNFLAPMFNSFRGKIRNAWSINVNKVLDNAVLRKLIDQLATKVDFPAAEIVCMDGSTRSEHANAFIMGSGRNKKIVLYDNMLDLLTTEETVAVLAHEMGHYKFHHANKTMLLQIGSMGFYLFLLSQTMYSVDFYKSFGFEEFDFNDEMKPGVGLCLFSYLYQPLGNAMSVLSNVVSRSFEYTCDEFALELGYDMEPPLIQMHVNSINNLIVDKHYSRYYNSHPSLMERLEHIEEWKRRSTTHRRTSNQQKITLKEETSNDFEDESINLYLKKTFHYKTQ
ncbi:CAAX prenyl protease FACE1 [Acrasis kona]|uniref:CAAX prenyl protease n=1 Tax=Acrasis kona TaxID=1008807 RepID=A0AAW2Z3Y9_9EUKA